MHKSLYFDFFFFLLIDVLNILGLLNWFYETQNSHTDSSSQRVNSLRTCHVLHDVISEIPYNFIYLLKKQIINKEERVWERKLKITFTFRFTCIIYSSFHTTIPNPKKLKRKKQQNFSQSGQTKEEAVTEYIVWFVTLLLFCFAPIQFIFNSIQFIFQMVSCTYFTFFLCIIFNHSLTIKLLSLLLVILVLPQIKISFKSSQNR